MKRVSQFLLVFYALLVHPVFAQPIERNNLWVMWEHMVAGTQETQFRSHVMVDVPMDQARIFFENLTPSAETYGTANVVHQKSPLCLAQNEAPQPTLVDTTGLAIANKLETLKGLNGVFVDLRAVRGPRTFTGDFGAQVHKFVAAALTQSGIPLLTKEQLAVTPGLPTLTLRYSGEVTGCRPWSLSIGLKQTSVLTRDTRIMLEGTTWTHSARQSEENIDYNALDALRDAVAKFVEDYAKANSVNASATLSANVPAN